MTLEVEGALSKYPKQVGIYENKAHETTSALKNTLIRKVGRTVAKASLVTSSLLLGTSIISTEPESIFQISQAEALQNIEIQKGNDFDNAKIVDEAVAENGKVFPTGWAQPGECMVSAQRWANAANGGKNIWNYSGSGVISIYTNSGGAEVGLDQLKPGDILQKASSGKDADTNWDHVHTVVFRGYGDKSGVNIVDANRGMDGLVRVTDNYMLSAPVGWQWRAFRMGKINNGFQAKIDLPTFVPAMTQRPSGEIDIAVIGPNNSMDFYYNPAGTRNWGKVAVAVGGYAFSSPAMIQRPTGETDIAVQGPNNELDFYMNTPGSPYWGKLMVAGPGSAYGKPAIIQRPSGETDIAVEGPNHSLNYYFNAQGSPNWGKVAVAVPNYAYSSPAMALRASGEIDIAVQGPGNSMDFYYNAPGSNAWGVSHVAVNGWAFSTPSMVQRQSGETDIAVQGPNNSLDFYMNSSGSPYWGRIAVAGSNTTFTAPNPPAITQRPSGETDIAVKGPGDQANFYFNAQGSGNWGKSPVATSGYNFRAPVMWQRPSTGETDMAIVGPNNRLDFYFNAAGSPYWGNVPIASNQSAS